MSSIRDILLSDDPLRHEPAPPPEERERLRRTVIAAASGKAASAGRRPRAGIILAPVALLLAIAVAGFQVWRTGGATLQAAIRFEVRLAEDQPGPGLRAARVADSDRVVYVYPETIVTNEDIARTSVVEGEPAGQFRVVVNFTGRGAGRLTRATAGHIGGPAAVLIDGEVVMAPVLRSAIGESAQITGDFSRADAERIADGIRMR